MKQRIAKVIAQNGYCSRRKAEELILQGQVYINGSKISECATFVEPGDNIRVGKTVMHVPRQNVSDIKLFMMNKPIGFICTEQDEDERDRQTVFSLIPKKYGRLIMVGRLDFNSEGLLLFTNNGKFAEFLMHPRTELKRLYRVRINGKLTPEQIADLEAGLIIGHERFKPFKVHNHENTGGKNSWVLLELAEGRNREIRRAMESFGYVVAKLVRVAYADLALGKIDAGKMVEIEQEYFKELLEKFTQEVKGNK
jgi:23S rRNA pseudouridine2605 synthase